MLDIGWTEMAIIAFVALIIIGPKDLPTAMRGVAKWVRKARSLSREFQSGLDEMMRESELDEAKKSIESVRRYRVDELVEKEVDPTGTVRSDLKQVDDEARDRRRTGAAEDTASKDAASKGAGAGKTAAAGNGADGAGAAAGGKGRVVSHEARMAPGNSVKPPPAAADSPATPAPAAPSPSVPSPSAGAAKSATATKGGTAKSPAPAKAPARKASGGATKSAGGSGAASKTGTANRSGAAAKPRTGAGGSAKAGGAKGGSGKAGASGSGAGE